jgi:hypothetical protein
VPRIVGHTNSFRQSKFKFSLTPSSFSTKTLKVKLKAEIEDLPAKYKANGAVKFEVIEVEEDKGKKTKLVVVNSKFELNDIEKIQEWKDLKIYSANA